MNCSSDGSHCPCSLHPSPACSGILAGTENLPLQRPQVLAVSSTQLFWEQELGCLGGRGVAKGLGRRARGEGQQLSDTEMAPVPRAEAAPLASTGHKDTQSRGHWCCHLKELPLSGPQVSGNQMLGELPFFFFGLVLKQQGLTKANCIFNSGRGVYTHTQAKQTSPSLFF